MNRILLALLLLPITTFSQTLAPPIISHASGFYTDSFYVKITHPDPDVTILYTLDGSEPRIENLSGKVWNYKKIYPTNPGDVFGPLLQDTLWTYKYTDSVLVRDRSSEPDRYADISATYFANEFYCAIAKHDSVDVFKGAVLRVVAYSEGIYSRIFTKNYFVSQQGASRYSLPVVCLNVEPDKFFSYENGLNVPGIEFDNWRNNNPQQPIDWIWGPGNFRAEGAISEIELHFSYLVNGSEVLNHGAGLRIHGRGSRFYPNRSYRLYAKSSYGASDFNYSFFPNYFQNKFKRLILRNSGSDTEMTMFRDAFIHQVSKKMNVDIQEYQPAILFVNGEYFGLYNIRERFDDKYFEGKYNVNNIDFLGNLGVVEEGDDIAYQELMDYLDVNSLASENNFKYVSERIDIENYTDYFITEVFTDNLDWPTNNIEYWRKKTAFDPTTPKGHDGRWRWVLKDLDLSLGNDWASNVNHDNLERVSTESSIYPDLNKSTLIFRRLLENDRYRTYFINRFCDILNSSYKSEILVAKILEMKENLSSEIEEFILRYSPTNQHILTHQTVPSYSKWESSIDGMISFSINRAFWVKEHIKNRFDIENESDVVLAVSDTAHGIIRLNSIDIDNRTDGINSDIYPWSGIYFKNVPITLKAFPKEGYKFSHWSGEINDTVGEVTLLIDHDIYVKANFIKEIVIVDNPDTTDTDSLSVTYGKVKNNNIVLYPNPASDYINVLSDAQDMNYEIVTIDGRLISLGVMKGTKIGLLNMEKGEYILRLFNDKQVAVKKFVKY